MMTRNSLNSFLFFTLLIIAVIGCKKDQSSSNEPAPVNTSAFYSGNKIVTSFIGTVRNANSPIVGAEVQIGPYYTTTDLNGVFSFVNISVDEQRAYFKASSNGYFDGSRAIKSSPGNVNRVDIQLLLESSIGSIDATLGGVVNDPSGLEISFPANIVSNTDGSLYNGAVQVNAALIDPSTPDGIASMPGDLRALNSTAEAGILKSYVMAAVELKGDNGQELQITNGGSVEITFPVSSSLLDSAPSEIALWYFDEVEGVWLEEGTAQLFGDNYIGSVSHFSFWNCDTFDQDVELHACFSDFSDYSLEEILITIQISDGSIQTGYLDSENCLWAFLPAENVIEISGSDCNSFDGNVFSETIGPFPAGDNQELNFVTDVNVNASNTPTTISGILTNCEGEILGEAPYTLSSFNEEHYGITNVDGSFSSTVLCENTNFSIVVFDGTENLEALNLTVVSGENNDFGIIHNCEDNYYVYLTISDDSSTNTFYHPGPTAIYGGDCLYIKYSLCDAIVAVSDELGMHEGFCPYYPDVQHYVHHYDEEIGGQHAYAMQDDVEMNVLENYSSGSHFRAIISGTCISNETGEAFSYTYEFRTFGG